MKLHLLAIVFVVAACAAPTAWASNGVAIQKVITNTRAELGQLASSSKSRDIAKLLKRFDTQYNTWSGSCGGENFDPEAASDACQAMAEQMRETGIALYGKLASYLPDVAARYEQGARAAERILAGSGIGSTPAELYQASMNGDSKAPALGSLDPGDESSPFDLAMDDFPDPTDELFTALAKLVPDFGNELPEAVRAANARINMMKKARRARYLADQFSKAKFMLESRRDYGEIVFNITKGVSAMPKVLGIQYTGTRLYARPNQKVLDYYNRAVRKKNGLEKTRSGGFAPRS